MKRQVMKWGVGLLLLLPALGLLVSASGVIPVKASSGHWARAGVTLRAQLHVPGRQQCRLASRLQRR